MCDYKILLHIVLHRCKIDPLLRVLCHDIVTCSQNVTCFEGHEDAIAKGRLILSATTLAISIMIENCYLFLKITSLADNWLHNCSLAHNLYYSWYCDLQVIICIGVCQTPPHLKRYNASPHLQRVKRFYAYLCGVIHTVDWKYF